MGRSARNSGATVWSITWWVTGALLANHACANVLEPPDENGAGGSADAGASNEGGHAGMTGGPGGEPGGGASGGSHHHHGSGGAHTASGEASGGGGNTSWVGGANGAGGDQAGGGSGGASGGAQGGGDTPAAGGTGGSDPGPVNDCTTFVGRTAESASRELAWGFGIASAPERCMRVRVGQSVTFEGNFSTHPLGGAGGDTPNPIRGDVPVGVEEYMVTFEAEGTFGYECLTHSTMRGAISVVP